MPTFAPIVVGPHIGPVFTPLKGKREHYAHELSETSSLTDRVFQDNSASFKLPFPDYRFPNPLNVTAPVKPEPVIEQYRDMIREHVERRLFFFFQQLIVCYQTKLHFECSGAQDQANSADRILLNVNGKQKLLATRQAAHSSTIPCLIAYDGTAWENYQKGQGPKPAGFVFLKGTDYYRTVNATMNMPRWMNDADREIDEKTKDSLLRDKGLAIVNRVSQGGITPDQGIVEFIDEALSEIKAGQERLENRRKDPEVQKVLSLYEEHFSEFQGEIEDNPAFLENFLNIKLNTAAGNLEAQRVILQTRYKAIRNAQVAQAGLIQKVERVKREILAAMSGLGRKPTYFDAAFRTLLIGQARSIEDRQRLEKLFNFSPFDFEAKMNTKMKCTLFANVKTTLSQLPHIAKIQFLARSILQDMRSLRTQEEYERAQIIKDLRSMKNWQQWRLGREVKAAFPHAAASQSTISRIENRRKLVTAQIAQEFSRVFNVDPGLFMPHFFYD